MDVGVRGFRVVPTTTAMKLRYTDSKPIRDWCRELENHPAMALAREEAILKSVDLLLYGTAFIDVDSDVKRGA